MNLRPSPKEEPELNLISLIDIVFILLIFFIVTTTFNRYSEISINLPTASSAPLKAERKVVEVTIDAAGRYYVNQKEIANTAPETLQRAIQREAGGLKDIPFIISADGKTPHQAVIIAMDAARRLGFTRLTFTTQTAAPGT